MSLKKVFNLAFDGEFYVYLAFFYTHKTYILDLSLFLTFLISSIFLHYNHLLVSIPGFTLNFIYKTTFLVKN